MANESLFAIVGDDDYLVRKRSKEVFDGWKDQFPDELSREIIDGRANRFDEVQQILLEARRAGETM